MTELNRGMPPSHPGEVIKQIYVNENGFTGAEIARALGVSSSAINRIMQAKAAVTPIMALKLSQVLHGSPELWMNLQTTYDLWKAREAAKDWELRRLVTSEKGTTSKISR